MVPTGLLLTVAGALKFGVGHCLPVFGALIFGCFSNHWRLLCEWKLADLGYFLPVFGDRTSEKSVNHERHENTRFAYLPKYVFTHKMEFDAVVLGNP